MKIRIKFAKQGTMKFIGHLDVMRYFQKAMRRADVDIRYSEGFSPHQIMSFASPLGVGLTSVGEYMDIEVHSTDSSAEMERRLNEAMVEGFQVLSWRRLPDEAGNAMSLVDAADYTVRFRESCRPEDAAGFFSGLEAFSAQDSIPIVKKTKGGEGDGFKAPDLPAEGGGRGGAPRVHADFRREQRQCEAGAGAGDLLPGSGAGVESPGL